MSRDRPGLDDHGWSRSHILAVAVARHLTLTVRPEALDELQKVVGRNGRDFLDSRFGVAARSDH